MKSRGVVLIHHPQSMHHHDCECMLPTLSHQHELRLSFSLCLTRSPTAPHDHDILVMFSDIFRITLFLFTPRSGFNRCFLYAFCFLSRLLVALAMVLTRKKQHRLAFVTVRAMEKFSSALPNGGLKTAVVNTSDAIKNEFDVSDGGRGRPRSDPNKTIESSRNQVSLIR